MTHPAPAAPAAPAHPELMIDVANIRGGMKSSSMKKINEIVENYPEETNSLLNDENPDWIHGFNSGMLAGIRYSLDLNIYGKEDADDFFPSLDT